MSLLESEGLQPVVEPAEVPYGSLRSDQLLMATQHQPVQPATMQYYQEVAGGPLIATAVPAGRISTGVSQLPSSFFIYDTLLGESPFLPDQVGKRVVVSRHQLEATAQFPQEFPFYFF